MKADGISLSGEDAPITVATGSRRIHDRVLDAPTPGPVRIEAEVASPQGGDRVETGFVTLPRGVRTIDGRSGIVTTERADTTETFLDVPERAIAGATRLVVVLEPGVDAAILDALTFLDLFPYGCVEQTVHRFVPAAWARKALASTGSPDVARLERLADAIRQGYARLVNLRNDDGTYGWFRGGSGDPAMTAFALLGLFEAQALDVAGARDAVNRTAAALRRHRPRGARRRTGARATGRSRRSDRSTRRPTSSRSAAATRSCRCRASPASRSRRCAWSAPTTPRTSPASCSHDAWRMGPRRAGRGARTTA